VFLGDGTRVERKGVYPFRGIGKEKVESDCEKRCESFCAPPRVEEIQWEWKVFRGDDGGRSGCDTV